MSTEPEISPPSETDNREEPTPPAAIASRSNVTARILRQKIWKRCNVDNEHFMGCIVGREGSGKSGTALHIAELVDPTMSADRVFFDPADFMEWVSEDEREAGEFAIVDEAGVGMGSRTWYEKDQVLLNQALQTARDDNLAVLFTLPRLSELDSQTRGRLHAFLEMREKEDGEFARLAWKNIQPSRDERDKLYKKYPRMRVNGRPKRITSIRILPPSPELWEEYQGRKAEFKSGLYADTVDALRGEDGEDELAPGDVADEIRADGGEQFVSVHGGNKTRYVNWRLIADEYDLSRNKAKTVKDMLESDDSFTLT